MSVSRDPQKQDLLSDPDLDLMMVNGGVLAHEGPQSFVDARDNSGKRDGSVIPVRGSASKRKGGWVSRGLLLLIFAAAAAGGYKYWSQSGASTAPVAAAAPLIPVEAAVAANADVPVYFGGLGTVQAFNTVNVKTRVDGQIQTVNFIEGQKVKRGDLLVQIDPRPYKATYDQAVAKKAQDEAQLGNAKLDLARYTQLAKSNFGTRQQLDTQTALVAQLEAAIRADAASIDAAKVQLDYTTIVSPIDGVAGIRLVDIGNIVHASDATGIVVVTQLQPISIVFTLPEEDRQPVADAMAAGPVTVAALSRDGATEFDRGNVLLIDNQIDQTTGTMRLKATFPNAKNTLWPGQFVNTRLLLKTQQNVLTIPSAAVERGPAGFYAYVVKPDKSVEMRAIKVGQDADNVSVVLEGLQAGEQVVTGGQYRLQPGARVRIAEPKPATPAAKPAAAATATPPAIQPDKTSTKAAATAAPARTAL
ncbi:MAG: efflux transporter periplasmic adaptor subunit [Hyphomicrobiales bacterium]|nr:efflux transporter periplasmic adaptor subunit [Hyphomicrobiales bacterium]